MNKTLDISYMLKFVLFVCLCAAITSCGTGSGDGADDDGGGSSGVGSLTLRLSQTSVQSDNSDFSTITATVLDGNNAVMEGVTVTFSSTGGQFNTASTIATDTSGEAAVEFSSGADSTNQIATITASSGGYTRQIPVQITGSTLDLTGVTSDLEIGGGSDTLVITARDAGGQGIFGAPVVVSVDSGSTGSVNLSPSQGNTNFSGQLQVQVTGTQPGDVLVRAEAVGATGTQAYTVVTSGGGVFEIISPTDDPASLDTNTNLTITVTTPPGVTDVQFACTLGAWDGGAQSVVEKPVAGGTASAVFRSSDAGVATIQVSDADDAGTTDSMTIVVSAPSSEASQIALQASAYVVAPSIGGVYNSVTLEATVRNASDDPVGDAPVSFTIQNPTGGGESIAPAVVYTDGFGVAVSTFTSGSSSSGGGGVTVVATVVGPGINDSIAIVIGGTAGSVVIGQSTEVESINNDTSYSLPMSVLVADSNGNPMSGAVVTLSLWPLYYYTGFWVDIGGDECAIEYTPGSPYPNEDDFFIDDRRRNLILDPGEDANGDGVLTPPNSAAGSVPGSVITDQNGVANFDLVYLKSSAWWIDDELVASTMVFGDQTQATYTFTLPIAEGEECSLPHSPYNP